MWDVRLSKIRNAVSFKVRELLGLMVHGNCLYPSCRISLSVSALSFTLHVISFGMSRVVDGITTKSMPVRGGKRETTKRFSSCHSMLVQHPPFGHGISYGYVWELLALNQSSGDFVFQKRVWTCRRNPLATTPAVSVACISLALHVALLGVD